MARIQVIESASPDILSGFETIIDVRSPGEFAEDHLPGAINLPVLTDEQRAQVGTIYVQDSPFKASRIGAALVARNIAMHLETVLADKPHGFAPLVYCWRGGQRSESMATILSRVGWRTSILKGGYKTYRREVQARLYDQTCPLKLILLDGNTGTGKTDILNRLPDLGIQILDLENLAGHRGSLFGRLTGRPQPSQKMFETELLQAMDRLDPTRPVVVEAESSKIGDRMVPPALWQVMQASPRLEVHAPREERARYLVRAYADIVADQEALETAFTRLPVYPGQARLADWRDLAARGDFAQLAEAVIELHYDPAYARSSKKEERPILTRLDLSGLEDGDLDAAARAVADRVGSWSQTGA